MTEIPSEHWLNTMDRGGERRDQRTTLPPSFPIAEAPALPGKPFGPVLLWTGDKRAGWQLGRWTGEEWANEDCLIVHPLRYALVPETPSTNDAALIALFQKWRSANRDCPKRGNDAEIEAADDRVIDFERRIFDTPADGIAGVAIKIFLLAVESRGQKPFDTGEVEGFDESSRCNGRLYLQDHCLKGLVVDAARFFPEIAPLVGEILNAPVELAPPAADPV